MSVEEKVSPVADFKLGEDKEIYEVSEDEDEPSNSLRDLVDVNEEFGKTIGTTNENDDDEDDNDSSGGDDIDDVDHDLDEDFEKADDLL
ncbi:hypothetical protein F0562_032397 [Nyssa sinensis]|uniref:Uncharacterized protein n=1 Tax=Nyssa sinensis TaxID=561372 RepID=A0A5J5AQ75_9ASTE|nr:hypothetical protein F0562_032397 [Nyssa sinensis]